MNAHTPPPPERASRLLRRYCPLWMHEAVAGDLEERFGRLVRTHGARKARWDYWREVVLFCLWHARKRPYPYEHARGPIMWKNYSRVALRNLIKNPLYSTINILGLAIGLAVCLLIFLYVQDERSYDTGFTHADRIHRVRTIFEAQQVRSEEAMIAYPAAPLLQNDFPEVEHATRLISVGQEPLFVHDERRFYEDGFFFADSNFFSVFDIPLLRGNPATALQEPSSLVLSASVARKYFDDIDPLGQTLRVDNEADMTVTGVMADLPHNTHLDFTILASGSTLPAVFGVGIMRGLSRWGWPSTYTYLLLEENADPAGLQAKLPDFKERNEVQSALSLYLQPLTDIHLHSHLELEMAPNGNATQVYAFMAIAVLILLIACINFMNLATARSTLRAREVGMRKVVGARRGQLTMQFLGESVMITLIALVIAIVLVELALPTFNAFLGKALSVGYLGHSLVVPGLLALGLIVGVGAGLYPAFYLSSSSIQSVLRGITEKGGGHGLVRKGLVVMQFAVSIILVVATGVVFAQMDYARNLPLGYEKEHVVVVSGLNRLPDEQSYETLRTQLLQQNGVLEVTSSSIVPTDALFAGTGFRLPGMGEEDEPLFYRHNRVDYEFFDALGIEMVAGRGFSRTFGTDAVREPTEEAPEGAGAIVMNEAAVAKAGWTPDEALGKTLILGRDRPINFTVVGVAKDIYYSSIRYAIEPVVYFVSGEGERNMAAKVAAENLPATLEAIDQTWASVVPDYPITRSFLDDRFNALYDREAREATVITYFALLAVFLACLGLLGLAAFTAERRRKEIGVRKVLGASVRDIVLMLSWDFTRLVIIANVIAWPAAYFLMKTWLNDYAYRVEIGWELFLLAGFLAFLIAWATVGFQAGRAALMNPVHAIRDE